MDTASKKQLHHAWRYIRPLKPWYIMVVLVLLVGLTVVALRINYQTMVTLRQSVYTADEQNKDVELAMYELRQFVYSHMNTDLTSGQNSVFPPIQLKHTYDRLAAAEQERIKTVNETIYSDAQAYCEAKYPQSYSGGPRVPCIQEYIAANGVQPRQVPDSLYKFDFVSPFWSPDAAGWLLVLTVLTTLLLVVRVAVPFILRKTHVL